VIFSRVCPNDIGIEARCKKLKKKLEKQGNITKIWPQK
jgi:hypothetical protein